MKKILFLYFILFLSKLSYGQFADKSYFLIDSLDLSKLAKIDSSLIVSTLNKYYSSKSDTTKLKLLEVLIENCTEDKIWLQYNKYFLKEILRVTLSKKNHEKSIERFLQAEEAMGLNNYGYYYLRIGNNDEALSYYLRSLKIREAINDRVGLGASYNNLGRIYKDKGNVPLAIEYYDKSLKIQEQTNDKKGMSYSLNNLGSIYNSLGEKKSALINFKKSLKIRREIGDLQGEANVLVNIGNILLNEEKYNEALENYTTGLELRKGINDKRGVASSYNAIGTLFYRQNDLKKALEYFNQSLIIENEISDNPDKAITIFYIASVYFKSGENAKAKKLILDNLALYQKLSNPSSFENIYSLLHKIYLKEKDWKNTYENYFNYITFHDSLNNLNLKKLAVKQQFQHEYEKKASADSLRLAGEKKVTDAKLEKEKTQRYALYGGLILVLIFSGFMINRVKVTQRQKKLIEIKERETQSQKDLIESQKHIVDEKQKEILDSIHYALRIQKALLANEDVLKENLKDHFVFFHPKDIVSGDFYWATHHENRFYLAVCDSTGHGVPGAFMSLLNIGFLAEAINENGIAAPNEVFNYVRKRLINSISKEGQADGFDGILLCIDKNNNKLTYAAANNKPIVISENQILELKCDKMPVGKGEKSEGFTLYDIELKNDDTLFLYTDGYADQFGGPKGKKFKYKELNNLIRSLVNHSLSEQKDLLKSNFESWRGHLEQIDDVCVIGIKI